ncbi:MAG TPA: hypothetical protein VEL07_15575 [Planctomycetota bacterium]|nr:hypothetical protein [Planctomycetota bacterium]
MKTMTALTDSDLQSVSGGCTFFHFEFHLSRKLGWSIEICL